MVTALRKDTTWQPVINLLASVSGGERSPETAASDVVGGRAAAGQGRGNSPATGVGQGKGITGWANAGFYLEGRNSNTAAVNYNQTPLTTANSGTDSVPGLTADQWSSLINLLKNHMNSDKLC